MPKTIFGTTEKSNFILNMNKTTVEKWINGLLYGCIVILFIGGAVITAVEKANAFMGSFLYAAGFSCILFYIVLLLRKDIKLKNSPAAFLAIAMALLAFASYYRVVLTESSQEYINTALLGETGRYEGLLSIIAYFGIFLLATCAPSRETVKKIFFILVCSGIMQAVIAVMQHIPWDFPSDFRKLPAILLLKNVNLSSGLSDSPIFYGTFLTIVSGIAIAGAVWEEDPKIARIYGAAAMLFFLTGLFTSSVIPLIGIGADVAVVLVIEIFNKNGKKYRSGLLNSSKKRICAVILGLAAIFGIVFAAQGIYLRDKAIAYSDAFNRLYIVGSPSPVNEKSLWEIGRERSVTMIKDSPILGIGEDLMAKKQLESEELMIDSIDRSYNEYLYTAATRGVPASAVYILLIGMVIYRLIRSIKRFYANGEKWYIPALLAAVLAYSVQAWFGASAVTVAPYFWLLLGVSLSETVRRA